MIGRAYIRKSNRFADSHASYYEYVPSTRTGRTHAHTYVRTYADPGDTLIDCYVVLAIARLLFLEIWPSIVSFRNAFLKIFLVLEAS